VIVPDPYEDDDHTEHEHDTGSGSDLSVVHDPLIVSGDLLAIF
jgi:hypothetical protein